MSRTAVAAALAALLLGAPTSGQTADAAADASCGTRNVTEIIQGRPVDKVVPVPCRPNQRAVPRGYTLMPNGEVRPTPNTTVHPLPPSFNPKVNDNIPPPPRARK